MKRKMGLFIGLIAIAVSSMAFSGVPAQSGQQSCPLKGTPLCPQYPACCVK